MAVDEFKLLPITAVDHCQPDSPCIKMHKTSRFIDLANPTVESIAIEDIAWNLSMIPRYAGSLPAHYSVAEHSLNVAAQLWRTYHDGALAFAGLFHDAPEAYLGDVTRPLKSMLPDYRAVEERFTTIIGVALSLTVSLSDPRIKDVDHDILPWEMAMIRDAWWRTESDQREVYDAFLLMARSYIHQAHLDAADDELRHNQGGE